MPANFQMTKTDLQAILTVLCATALKVTDCAFQADILSVSFTLFELVIHLCKDKNNPATNTRDFEQFILIISKKVVTKKVIFSCRV